VLIQLYGLMGEMIQEETVTGIRKKEFSVEDQPSGIYMIRVTIGDRTEVKKILILE